VEKTISETAVQNKTGNIVEVPNYAIAATNLHSISDHGETFAPIDDKSNEFVRWFIFVPLCILIFIVSILSILGFFVLVMNSASTLTSITDKDYENATEVSKANYLTMLRLKKELKKKKKAKEKCYRAEPEAEGMVM